LLTGAAVLPALSWAFAAKPTIGAALFAAFPSRQALVGGLVLTGLAFLIQPRWPAEWWHALGAGTHMSPIVARPAGFLVLLALIRWREPEARLLVALGCVPQTLGLYETLPLFLVPRTRWQGYGLAGLSYVAAFAQAALVPRLPGMPLDQLMAARWPVVFGCLYLPALAMLLLSRRPDAGAQGM
jgi:hypothetical protein